MKVVSKKECPKCFGLYSTRGNNHERHVGSCTGEIKIYKKEHLKECKYCFASFEGMDTSQRANHSRWCDRNPKRDSYIDRCRSTEQLQTKEAIEKRSISISKAHKEGKYKEAAKKSVQKRRKDGTLFHTEETKKILSEKALASKHRRLVRSVREYTKKDGTTILLDSSWEEALAIRLDELGIEWIRPEIPIEYIGKDGKPHNYFPDFYLPEKDLYLDPKNPAAIYAQKDKLDCLKTVLDNLIIIDNLESCKNFII